MKSPQQLFKGAEKKNGIERRLLIAREIFIKQSYCKENSEWENFLKVLNGDNKKRLGVLSHFYYFICRPFSQPDEIRDELRIVAITSLMEEMMSEEEYKTFFEWFESIYRGTNVISDYRKIKEEYLDGFGLTKKVKSYFENYITDKDKKLLLSDIKVFKNGKFSVFDDIDKIATFLYGMRSEFVHSAKMITLRPPGVSFATIVSGKKCFLFKISIGQFLSIFERSFVNYWAKKSGVIFSVVK